MASALRAGGTLAAVSTPPMYLSTSDAIRRITSAEQLTAELAGLRAEVAAAKKAAEAMPVGSCDWSEADTRRYKIDALLAEAGWVDLAAGRDVEYRVRGDACGFGGRLCGLCAAGG